MNDKSNVSLLGESDSSVHGELHQGSPCMVNPTSCMKHISPCMNFSVRKRLRSYRNCLRGSEDDDGLLGRRWEAGHCNRMIMICSTNRRSMLYPFIWFTKWSIFHVNCITRIDIGISHQRGHFWVSFMSTFISLHSSHSKYRSSHLILSNDILSLHKNPRINKSSLSLSLYTEDTKKP